MKRWGPVAVGVVLMVLGAVAAVAAWPGPVTLTGMQMQGEGGPPVVWPSPVPSAIGLTAVVVGAVVALLGWWRPAPGRVSTWGWGLAASVVAVVGAHSAWISSVRAYYKAVYMPGEYMPPEPVAPLGPQVLTAGWVFIGTLAAVVVCLLTGAVLAVRAVGLRGTAPRPKGGDDEV